MKNFQNISEKKWYKFWKGSFSEENIKLDLQNLAKFYKNNGYKDIQIISNDVQFLSDGIFIKIIIDEGEINYYKEFNFNGNFKFTNAELLQTLDLKSGERYNEEQFNMSMYNLNSRYMNEGYYFIKTTLRNSPFLNTIINNNRVF